MGGRERLAGVESATSEFEEGPMAELLEELQRGNLTDVSLLPDEALIPPAPPAGLDTILYEHDDRTSRADLRRQIAAMELELARLFTYAFPRQGIEFRVAGAAGPRVLSVDELERVRDSLAARIQDVKACLHDQAHVETKNRELIERMTADPESYRWIRVSNADIGEPGCKHWHARPRWGPLGMLMGWWRVKISSGCPLAKGLRPPDAQQTPETEAPPAANIERAGAGEPAGAGSERCRHRRAFDASIV
jgi:hypothetical protein